MKQNETVPAQLDGIVNTKEMEKKIEVEALLDRAILLTSKIEKYKEFYKELDEITEKLRDLKFVSMIYKNKPIHIEDNFKDKNCVFRVTGVRRFEIKIG